MIRGSLLDGIQEALSQFNRLLQATKQNNVSPHAVAAGNDKADMDMQCMHVYIVTYRHVHGVSGCFKILFIYCLSFLSLSSLPLCLSVSLCLCLSLSVSRLNLHLPLVVVHHRLR